MIIGTARIGGITKKQFSIVRRHIHNAPSYYLCVSRGAPFLENGEIIVHHVVHNSNDGEEPTKEEVRHILKRLRKSARKKGIEFVVNLDIRR